eukprot:6919898-Prymnesium_polylepis.2
MRGSVGRERWSVVSATLPDRRRAVRRVLRRVGCTRTLVIGLRAPQCGRVAGCWVSSRSRVIREASAWTESCGLCL